MLRPPSVELTSYNLSNTIFLSGRRRLQVIILIKTQPELHPGVFKGAGKEATHVSRRKLNQP